MEKQFIMAAIGLSALGLISSVVVAKENKTVGLTSQYELTKSCKKGYVKSKKNKCVKLTCGKNHYLNKAKTKCLPKRTMSGGS